MMAAEPTPPYKTQTIFDHTIDDTYTKMKIGKQDEDFLNKIEPRA